MTAPYSLRTLLGPELRDKTALALAAPGVCAVSAGAATAVGATSVLLLSVLGILFGMIALKPVDERAREIASEA